MVDFMVLKILAPRDFKSLIRYAEWLFNVFKWTRVLHF